jgi:ABC-2 type transport system permease protein
MTLVVSLVGALVLPVIIVLTVLRPIVGGSFGEEPVGSLGAILASYLLIIGLLPASAAVGIAAGQFAGEKEQGSLAPLLASPASNVAIFGGKVLGAVIPALLFSLVAELAYLGSLALVSGPDLFGSIPPGAALAMLALVPAYALFATTVASLISSRVRTYNTAQQIAGLVLLPAWGALLGLAFTIQHWGPWALVAAVAGLLTIDVVLLLLAAATWRREEVLAQR